MPKRFVALLLAVMLVFLSACGTAQNQYDAAAVFAAQQQERAAWLADPDDAALWEALGLSGTVVLGEQITSRTIGAQSWLLQPAEVEGRSVTLCYCLDEQGRPLLDLRASFGLNSLPVEEWRQQSDLFTVRVTAALGGELPQDYETEGLSRYSLLLTDPVGGEVLPAVAGDAALYELLSDGEPHAVCLRLRAMQGEEPLLRVTHLLCEGWLEAEAVLRAQSEQLLWAARHGESETVRLLLNAGNAAVTDPNGDGLLFLALQSGDAQTVKLVADAGCGDTVCNIYRVEEGSLTAAERQDWQQMLAELDGQGVDTGCTAPSIAYYYTVHGEADRLALYLDHYPAEFSLSAEQSHTVALQYGVESAQEANLLDLAILRDDVATAQVLLGSGAGASGLLKKKLQAAPTDFSDEMLALLGSRGYFGVLDDVLEDYRAFRDSYEEVAGESCRRFEQDYADYCIAVQKGDTFAAAGIMDSGLLEEIVGQLEAVQQVQKPQTEAINALWDLMFQYADMMDTAGYYYKRISLSTYIVTRRYYRALFEDRLGRAHTLYEQFKHETEVYDWLLENLG